MKRARERIKKALTIVTKKETSPATREATIKECTEMEVHKAYRIGAQVMSSSNAGMEILHAIRLSDGLACVMKSRKKADSFKTEQEEREWRHTTLFQMNMPKIPTLCQFYEVLETKEKYYVVMEKVEGRDLFEQMGLEHPSHIDSREIARQTLEALRVMHAGGRIHKDIKIENVMVDMDQSPSRRKKSSMSIFNSDLIRGRRMSRSNSENLSSLAPSPPGMTKIIDFDTVQDWEPNSPKSRDVLGTDGYIAPEAYDGEYSPASDVYAVGVIMYKLLTGRFPSRASIFDDKPGENWVGSPSMKRIQRRLRSQKIKFACHPFDQCPEARELLTRMLAYNVGDRPSCEEALRAPYFMVPAKDLP
eukprot:TRINITY_DN13095_c0_g2_i1.p1 TRINITY_DN13095_c0_g2~~TRINITY_DN13095_c0_g2_i1.p1  ORF type:complete len:361 (+),score=52.43 TRINITY_DN13095_c0_g2_i1:96-1178(+)